MSNYTQLRVAPEIGKLIALIATELGVSHIEVTNRIVVHFYRDVVGDGDADTLWEWYLSQKRLNPSHTSHKVLQDVTS